MGTRSITPIRSPVRGSCEGILWGDPVRESCEGILWGNPVRGFCEGILWGNPVRESCEGILWGDSVRGSCEGILWGNPARVRGSCAVGSYKAILLRRCPRHARWWLKLCFFIPFTLHPITLMRDLRVVPCEAPFELAHSCAAAGCRGTAVHSLQLWIFRAVESSINNDFWRRFIWIVKNIKGWILSLSDLLILFREI